MSNSQDEADLPARRRDAMGRVADVISVENLLANGGGDRTIVAEIALVFERELPEIESELDVATASGDGRRLSRAAHRLKGSLLVLGAIASGLAEEVEREAGAGNFQHAAALVPLLKQQVAGVVPALREIIQESLG